MAEATTIDYYWRPGCPFCMMLERSLSSYELPLSAHNIWDDPEAAAYVRSVADGNETVPTVRIGSVALVNPSPGEVLTTIASEAPELLPAGVEPPEPGRIGRVVNRLLGGD